MFRSYLYIKKPSTRDAWLFVEKSYDSSTGYNFLRKLIIAPLLDFRKQKCERRGSLCIFLEHGLQPKTVHAFMLGTMASELSKFGLIKKLSGRDACIKKQSIFASCMLLFV